jgi:hypothetical protein
VWPFGASVRPLGIEIRSGCHTGEIELTAGSGLVFEEAGERELKGVPDVGGCTASHQRSHDPVTRMPQEHNGIRLP